MYIQDLKGILEQAKMMKNARVGLPRGACDEGQPLSQHIVALVFETVCIGKHWVWCKTV